LKKALSNLRMMDIEGEKAGRRRKPMSWRCSLNYHELGIP
jgi:hypothetical protein